ncbi:MAG: hypothetical protein NXI31_14400 [bacterium]|nr:hypothetical protein [bacterium]
MSASRKPLQIAGIVLGVLLLGVVLLSWQFNRPPFPLDRLDRLTHEMSKEQVHEILGAPSDENEDNWAHSRVIAWPIVYVYFDSKGNYTRHRYDF